MMQDNCLAGSLRKDREKQKGVGGKEFFLDRRNWGDLSAFLNTEKGRNLRTEGQGL